MAFHFRSRSNNNNNIKTVFLTLVKNIGTFEDIFGVKVLTIREIIFAWLMQLWLAPYGKSVLPGNF